MFNVEGSEDFYDCTVRGAKQKLRNKCETVIVHETTERTLELISEETLKCEDKFEIVPTHEQNRVCEFKNHVKPNA